MASLASSRRLLIAAAAAALAGAGLLAPAAASAAATGSRVSYMSTLSPRPAGPGGNAGANPNLYYHGGVGGIGVETAPRVYLVLWGSQWNNNDPSKEASILQGFLGSVGGNKWLASVTQYCQGITSGTADCTGATLAGDSIVFGSWADNAAAAPKRPSQSQLAAEAARAAAHFTNTTAASNASAQYVVATATGNSASGFGTRYCAWHSSTSSSYGTLAYTNLPYITDAGRSCGANFVNGGTAGLTDGITIVEGHELAETITDQFPNGGWLDSSGAENGDKCAWISSGSGAATDISLAGGTYAVQSLWSNATSSCVTQ